jgi:hypothetical protein
MRREAPHVPPHRVRDRIEGGSDMLLVCAYEEDKRFEQNELEGAIPLSELRSRLPALPKRTEIVFYCS